MPVPLRVYGASGQQADLVLNNTFNGEEIIAAVPFTITSVVFDPKKHIISKNNSATLGNEDFDMVDAIVIYPNPSTDIVQIQMPTSLVLEKATIYNSLGQKIAEHNSLDFSVSYLSSGVHYLQIETSEGTYHKKFIKK
jgi:hypothetical protein